MRRGIVIAALTLAVIVLAAVCLLLAPPESEPPALSPAFVREPREDTAHYMTREGDLLPQIGDYP